MMVLAQEQRAWWRETDVQSPTWYRVAKQTSMYQADGYYVTYADTEYLMRGQQSQRWSGRFRTREEAVKHAEDQGWVKVKTWKEARELARPYMEQVRAVKREAAKAADEQRKHTAQQVAEAVANLTKDDGYLKVWVGADGDLRMERKDK